MDQPKVATKPTGDKRQGRLRLLGRLAFGSLVVLWLLVGPWPLAWVEDLSPNLAVAPRSTVRLPNQGKFSVGAASVPLKFAANLPLAGYGHRAFTANCVPGDPLFVRAIVLERDGECVALVTADLLFINRAIVENVEKKLTAKASKWNVDRIFFGATHTHSAPGGYPSNCAEMIGAGWKNPAVLETIGNAVVEALNTAASNAVKGCEFAHVAFQAPPDLIRNRNIATDPVNPWFDMLLFRRVADCRPVACAAVFSAHATCSPSNDPQVSADYPGVFATNLEAHLGCPVAFFAGGVGAMGPGGAGDRKVRAKWLGDRLADVAKTELAKDAAFDVPNSISLIKHQFTLPRPAVKIAKSWVVSPIAASALLPGTSTLSVLRLGDCVLAGAPCDFNGVAALELRPSAQHSTRIVTSFAGDYIGYTVPEAQYDLQSYEPRSMTFFGRRFSAALTNAIAQAAANQ